MRTNRCDKPRCDNLRGMRLLLAITLVAAAIRAQDRPLASLPYTPSLEPAFIDRSVDPCTDFRRFSCGSRVPFCPTRQARVHKLAQENLQFLWGVLSGLRSLRRRTANEQKIGDFFGACMDEAALSTAASSMQAPKKSPIFCSFAVRPAAGFAARSSTPQRNWQTSCASLLYTCQLAWSGVNRIQLVPVAARETPEIRARVHAAIDEGRFQARRVRQRGERTICAWMAAATSVMASNSLMPRRLSHRGLSYRRAGVIGIVRTL